MTKEQAEIAEFIRSKKLNIKVTFNGYMPLIDAFKEYAQKQVKKLILHDLSLQSLKLDVKNRKNKRGN